MAPVTPLVHSDPASRALRIGERQHVAQALLRIPEVPQKVLKPGIVYSYDLAINEPNGNSHTLESMGLLKTAPRANGGPSELARPHLVLGYIDDFLPRFALPPNSLDAL